MGGLSERSERDTSATDDESALEQQRFSPFEPRRQTKEREYRKGRQYTTEESDVERDRVRAKFGQFEQHGPKQDESEVSEMENRGNLRQKDNLRRKEDELKK